MNCSFKYRARRLSVVESAGFEGFEIPWRAAVFDGAPQESSAGKFGTKGINFRATKAG